VEQVTGDRRKDDRPDLGLMRRLAVAMFGVGALASGLGVVMTQTSATSRARQGVVTALLLLTCIALSALRRPSRRLLEGAVLWSLVLVGAVMAVAEPIGQGASFYLWPAVFAAYFSSRRVLLVTFGWLVVTLVVGTLANPVHEQDFDTIVSTVMTVGVMAAVVAVMTERERQLRADLSRAAATDPLTGLLNRRSFNPLLERLVGDARRQRQSVTVVMFDLDHFKRLNDQHGHPAGDRALQEVADVLRTQSREGDLVSRFGGEEFAIALRGAAAEDGRSYAERVAAALADRGPEGTPISTSAGISTLVGDESAEVLLSRADQSLYAAKQAGRGRHGTWGSEIDIGAPFHDEVDA
jgi:diguanylate cyclase (GGDEF)-like protein